MNNRIRVNGEIDLLMSGRDIGDYLGLELETVSREISKLSDEGILRRSNGSSRWQRGLTLSRPESLRAKLPRSITLDLLPVSEDVIQAIFSSKSLTG